MAKARRGRIPLPRNRSVLYSTNSKIRDEKKFKANFEVISDAFYCARVLRNNEAANLARYLLGVFFDGNSEVQTSVKIEGDGYDYTVSVSINEATMEMIQSKAQVIKPAA